MLLLAANTIVKIQVDSLIPICHNVLLWVYFSFGCIGSCPEGETVHLTNKQLSEPLWTVHNMDKSVEISQAQHASVCTL